MIDKNQKQENSGDAVGYQAGNNLYVTGLTYTEARQISLDLWKANAIEFSQQAASLAMARVEEFMDEFLSKLNIKNPTLLESLKDPGMQMSLYSAQKEYARTGDKETGDLLSDILAERAAQPQRDIKQIVLEESLNVASKLTQEDLDSLALSFILKRTINYTINSLPALDEYLQQHIEPFIANLRDESTSLLHIQYCSCGDISVGSAKTITAILKDRYTGLFLKGLSEAEFELKYGKRQDYSGFVAPCLHDSTLLQANATRMEVLTDKAKEMNLDTNKLNIIDRIMNENIMSDEDVKSYILNKYPYMEKLYNIWDKTDLRGLSLTSVGITIAIAHIKRKTGKQFDLSTWIS